jgi:phytoene dehydrogenase-like protein
VAPSLGAVTERYDAVIVGSGPNGLAAAIELARHDLHVLVVEGHDEIGGGTRTQERTVPGVFHDICAAAHPFGPASPFLSDLPLSEHGLEWITPPVSLAHPLDDGSAALLVGDVPTTAAALDADSDTYRRLFAPLARNVDAILAASLGPLIRIPRHPIAMARFGGRALLPATRLAKQFETPGARALIAGLAAHAIIPLHQPATSGVAIALALAGHRNGWPIVKGGSHELTKSMGRYLDRLGGEVKTGWWVESIDELPPARAVLLDITPRQFMAMAGGRLPERARARYRRWQYGPAAFKVDYALSAPIPWRNPAVATAGTVHVGGTLEEIAAAEDDVWNGRPASRPFVLVTQPSLFDSARAPEGRHVAWAYCHVPESWTGDATEAITSQIERFAPGFRDTIVGRASMGPAAYEAYNPNNVNGSISGGAVTLRQLVARPTFSPHPYATPIDDVYLCSAATAPGAGTHGMCGYHAAHTALRRSFGRRS